MFWFLWRWLSVIGTEKYNTYSTLIRQFYVYFVSNAVHFSVLCLLCFPTIYFAAKSYSYVLHYKILIHKMSHISNTNVYIFLSSKLCVSGLCSNIFKCKFVIIVYSKTELLRPSCNSTLSSCSLPLTSL